VVNALNMKIKFIDQLNVEFMDQFIDSK